MLEIYLWILNLQEAAVLGILLLQKEHHKPTD